MSELSSIQPLLLSLNDFNQIQTFMLSNDPDAWSQQVMHETLANPLVHCFALMNQNKPTALCIWQVVEDEHELLKVATDQSVRRQGLAYQLLNQYIKQQNINSQYWLEVRQSNMPAIALYQQLGFEQMSRRKKYYQLNGHTREDALVFKK